MLLLLSSLSSSRSSSFGIGIKRHKQTKERRRSRRRRGEVGRHSDAIHMNVNNKGEVWVSEYRTGTSLSICVYFVCQPEKNILSWDFCLISPAVSTCAINDYFTSKQPYEAQKHSNITNFQLQMRFLSMWILLLFIWALIFTARSVLGKQDFF